MTIFQGHRALRAGRASFPGHIYLLTMVTAYRRPLFRDDELARLVCRCAADPACWGDAELLCWVLMPDHWHGLVKLGDRDSLSLVVNRFKSLAAKRLRCTQAGVVWSGVEAFMTGRCVERKTSRRWLDTSFPIQFAQDWSIMRSLIRTGIASGFDFGGFVAHRVRSYKVGSF